MHDTALQSGAAFFQTYLGETPARVLDVGSANFNGSLRSVKPSNVDYIGVDLEAGPDVDIVVKAGEPLPFDAESFDAIVSTSCFEHDPMFWNTFLQMGRVVKLQGHIYISAPSNGPYHSYPHDNWRFYPDAGLALAQWARSQGMPLQLVESGTLMRAGDVWNDFIAVFQKVDSPPSRSHFLLDAFPSATNVRRCNGGVVENFAADTQDLRLLYDNRALLQQAEGTIIQSRYDLAGLEQRLAESERRLADSERRLADSERRLEEEATLMAALRADLEAARAVILERDVEIRQLSAALAERSAVAADRGAALAAMHASTSWRITAPLRWLRRAGR